MNVEKISLKPRSKFSVKKLSLFLIVLTKSIQFVKILKVVKLLKFTKFLVTFFTMTLSVFVYAFFLGPWFAIGLVLMLFIHEMGHVIMLKIKGIPTSPPVFIPMLGAVIFSPPFESQEDEASAGYSGPLVGSAAAFLLFGIWILMPHTSKTAELVLMVSYIAAFLNLFNLLPIRPFDGGRTTQIVGEWFKYIGFVALLGFTFLIRQPMMFLIWILVLQDIPIQPRLKPYLGIGLQASMMLLMLMGFGEQSLWIDILDIGFATLFNIFIFIEARKFVPSLKNQQMVKAPMQTRIKWFFLYVGLVAALILLMAMQAPHLFEIMK